MRQTVTTVLYLLLVEILTLSLIVVPVHAFIASNSATGFVRVVTGSTLAAWQSAHKAQVISALASAAVQPSAASFAFRLATGPVGWTVLGLAGALTLAQMWYSAADMQLLKHATSTANPSGWDYSVDGVSYHFSQADVAGVGQDIPGHPGNHCQFASIRGPAGVFTPPAPGLQFAPFFQFEDWWWCAPAANAVVLSAGGTPTIQQVQEYMNGFPATDPLSVEQHTQPVGQGVAISPAETVLNQPVSPTDLSTTVKPVSQVGPTDAVIDPNAPAPAGPQPPVPSTQTTTTTTTTTTNPDGSVTEQEDSTSSVSCSAGNHEARTFGSVLQDHMHVWQSSGLLSALNLLKTLAWPSAIPTYSLQSNLLGSFTLDFSAWSGMLTALRSLLIALAAFVAYRIIFVGHA